MAYSPAFSRAEFAALVKNVRAGAPSSAEELVRFLGPGVRFFISRSLKAANVDSLIGEILARAIEAIERHDIEEPEQLLTYVRGLVQLRICGAEEDRRRPSRRGPPDARAIYTLGTLSGRDLEVLRRYYVLGQEEGRILAEMHLSADQFRALTRSVRGRLRRAPGRFLLFR